jgi:ABC-2 type transport system permease protein
VLLTVWATFLKELLELRRNRTGLLVLLVMPMALVLIVSLVQDSVMQATGEAPIRVLFVDRDRSWLGEGIGRQLDAAGLKVVRELHGRPLAEETARQAVASGDYQFCVVIPEGAGSLLRERMRRQAAAAIALPNGAPEADASAPAPEVTVLFDPAVQGTFRTAVLNAMHRVMLGIELQEKAAILSEVLPLELKRVLTRTLGPVLMAQTGGVLPDLALRLDASPTLRLTEQEAFRSRFGKRPTAAQQNVPAWALFGMFFIVVPLSGALIRERETGAFLRVLTMPVSPLAVIAGKVAAWVLVCLAQFVLMVSAGMFLLPLLGTSGLVIGDAGPSLLLVASSAALAATGYGMMVGSLAKSYEQASMFGAVSIVIAAAIGGIMIPVYVMPGIMQQVSLISPLAWGLNAMQDLFVRGGDLRGILPEIASLLALFGVTMAVAWRSIGRSR